MPRSIPTTFSARTTTVRLRVDPPRVTLFFKAFVVENDARCRSAAVLRAVQVAADVPVEETCTRAPKGACALAYMMLEAGVCVRTKT